DMREDGLLLAGLVHLPDIDAEPDVVPLARGDERALVLAFEQDVPGIEILQANAPASLDAIGQQAPRALVEIEADARRAELRRRLRAGRVRWLCRRGLSRLRSCTRGRPVHGDHRPKSLREGGYSDHPFTHQGLSRTWPVHPLPVAPFSRIQYTGL